MKASSWTEGLVCMHPKCARNADFGGYACRAHWFSLPPMLREQIGRAKRQRDYVNARRLHADAQKFWYAEIQRQPPAANPQALTQWGGFKMAKKTATQTDMMGDVVDQDITKSLTFELTESEVAKKGREAAALKKELAKMREEFKEAQATLKGKIASKDQELSKILRLIDDGKEERTVACTMRKDYGRLVVQYVFDGKVHEERAMTIEERQLDLDTQRRRLEAEKKRRNAGDEAPANPKSELAQVIKEETNRKTKVDLVV